MPHLSGAEFYKRARWTAVEMVPRIIFMAGHVQEDAAAFLDRIPNRCLRKPVDPGMALDLVGMLAARNGEQAG